MSKRFTDDRKWSDEWWGSLPNDYRMIWLYLVDHCTIAGIWKKDLRGLNFHCNTNIDETGLVEIMAGRLVDLGKSFFIPNFIKFQYSNGLASDKPMIVSVKKELEQNNLMDIIKERLPNDYPIIKVMVKVNGNGKGNEKKDTPPKKKTESFSIPESWDRVVFDSLLSEFIEMRNKAKKPLTKNALTRRVQQLLTVSGGSFDLAQKIMLKSIDKAWDEFYPLNDSNHPKTKINGITEPSGIRDRA